MKPFALRSSLLLTVGAALIAFSPVAFAQNPAPAPVDPATFKPTLKQIELNDGDTLVFLGDSITHQCLYTQYIEDYYYTHFPTKRIHFHNSGVGGDRAADALRRFDDDVASFKPKYVTILLGMNDGTYRDFDKGVFDTYQRDMTKLLDQIAGLGAIAVPMTPTMHDARAARLRAKTQEPRDTYYNGVLALFGAWLREQASQRGLGFVDMYSPLNNLTTEARKTNAAYTLIKDAVHPDAPGQVVMAVAILNDMLPRGPVSGLISRVDAKGKRTVIGANGKVTDFKDGDTIRFTFTANALPWVLPAEAAEGYKLTHAGHRYSNEKITVGNLKAGKYQVSIDGTPVGTYTDAQLSSGVELEENTKTPQYQQALAVAELNKEKTDKAMHPLRDLWRDLKIKRRDLDVAKDAALVEKKAAFEKWLPEFKAKVEKMKTLVREYEEKIYAVNQPKPRHYEIAPTK
ncbi:MAG TPA: SGNH/GDSL hydrolase family protein [Verrucomicrobiae bacterium]|jgi:lysophospholipase L1-like esterase